MIVNGNTLSLTQHLKDPKTSPKSLQIRKKRGRPGSTVLFSELQFPAERFSTVDDFVTHVRDETLGDGTRMETVSLSDILSLESRVCAKCREPIPGNAARFVRLFMRIPNAGAEPDTVFAEHLCAACFTRNESDPELQTPSAVVELELPADDMWKQNLRGPMRRAWELYEQGTPQKQIAATLQVGQSAVSKMIAGSRKARDAYFAQKEIEIPSRNKFL